MKPTNYSNAAMRDICEILAEHHEMPLEFVRNLAADLPREYEGYMSDRAEAAYEAMYGPERLAARDEAYSRDMIAAGRGDLLK